MKESEKGNQEFPDNHNISFRNVQFAYEAQRPILKILMLNVRWKALLQ